MKHFLINNVNKLGVPKKKLSAKCYFAKFEQGNGIGHLDILLFFNAFLTSN